MQSWFEMPSKIRWKLFRQFQSPEQLKSDAACQKVGFRAEEVRWHWQPVHSSSDEFAEKLLLRRIGSAGESSEKDGSDVQCEAVSLMPPKRAGAAKTARATACISSQPGCGVGCPFCATGRLGYQGNLSAAEIAEQVYWVGRQAALRGRRLRNVVYMGMGEPLHNVQHVFQSLEWLTHPALFGLAERRITVSTVGVPSAMLDLARRFQGVKLALSLHSADPQQRRQLVPKAVGDLEMLREVIRQLNHIQSEGVWLEVIMLGGVNDTLDHAQLLARFCGGLKVEVNLIPYNSTNPLQSNSILPKLSDAPRFIASNKVDREAFARVLRSAGIRTTIRTSFGSESSAACGQLQAAQRD